MSDGSIGPRFGVGGVGKPHAEVNIGEAGEHPRATRLAACEGLLGGHHAEDTLEAIRSLLRQLLAAAPEPQVQPERDKVLSKTVSLLLVHHEYALTRRLLADHRVDHLILDLPAGWQAHEGSLAGIFEGAAIPRMTLGTAAMGTPLFAAVLRMDALVDLTLEVPADALSWGSAARTALLPVALELLQACPQLQTFRLHGPCLPRRYLPAVLKTMGDVPVAERRQLAERLQSALARTQLRTLVVQGQTFPRITGLGFCRGVGANTSLRELDLRGCTFVVNELPSLIAAMSTNASLVRFVPPAPDTLLFRLKAGMSLLYPGAKGEWSVHAALPNAPFAQFEQGGDAFVKSLAIIAHPWNVRRLQRARDPETRRCLIQLQAAFMAFVVHYQRGHGAVAANDPRVFVDAAGLIVDDVIGAGFLRSIVRLGEVSRQLGTLTDG